MCVYLEYSCHSFLYGFQGADFNVQAFISQLGNLAFKAKPIEMIHRSDNNEWAWPLPEFVHSLTVGTDLMTFKKGSHKFTHSSGLHQHGLLETINFFSTEDQEPRVL